MREVVCNCPLASVSSSLGTLEEALLQALLGFGFRDGSGSGSGAGGSREEQQQQDQRAPHGWAGGAALVPMRL